MRRALRLLVGRGVIHMKANKRTSGIQISSLNNAPTANLDYGQTWENRMLLVDVLANDTDVDAKAILSIIAASSSTGQGTASVVKDPGSDFDYLAAGESRFVLVDQRIEYEYGASSSSNASPIANPDAATTSRDSGVVIDVLANDYAP